MKAFTTKALVVAIIIFVAMTIAFSFGDIIWNTAFLRTRVGDWAANNVEEPGNIFVQSTLLLFGLMTVIVLILSLVNMVSKEPLFSKQEVALITLVLPITILVFAGNRRNLISNIITMPLGAYTLKYDTVAWYPLLSPILGPQDTALYDAMFPAGASINWGAWLPTVSWAIIYGLGPILTMFFACLLVQSVWVHEERLPFPMATLHDEMIEITQKSETGKSKLLNRYLLIGLLLGLVWLGPTHLQMWYTPEWTTGLLWPGGPNVILRWGGGPAAEQILPWSTFAVNLMPYAIGWGFLNTIPNLIGAAATGFIVFVIVPVVMYNMGLLTSPASHSTQPRIQLNQWLKGYRGFGGAGEVSVGILLGLGAIVGVLVYSLWRSRRQYAAPLLALVKKPSPEAEKNSPLSYQLIWIGLIVSFVIWVAAGVAINIPAGAWILWAIIVTVVSMGLVRLLSETGGYFGSPIFSNWIRAGMYTFLGVVVISLTGLWGEVNATNVAAVMAIGMHGALMITVPIWAIQGGWLSTHIFKVASDNKLDIKRLLKIVLALIVACIVIGFVFNLWLIHYVPLSIPSSTNVQAVIQAWGLAINHAIARFVPAGGQMDAAKIHDLVSNPALMSWFLLPFIIGFAVIVVAYFLRGRFSWFIIGPAGIAMGTIVGYNVWAAWLAALVIKYLVIKVGGMKLYNEKALPFFIGSLLAYFLIALFGTLGWAFVNPGWWA